LDAAETNSIEEHSSLKDRSTHSFTTFQLEGDKPQTLNPWIYQGIMLFMIVVATVAISADAPTVQVIQVAQTFNGCLLPFFSACLLVCLNDANFMKDNPQKWSVSCLL
jgi:Mn2+/Fe2+ NRAMP family transporter